MRTVLTLLCVLFVAHHAAAQCTAMKQYDMTLNPACDPNDLYIKWPNYEDEHTYYRCASLGTAVEMSCPAGQYFCYVLQQCVTCANYIPPVQCSQLKTQNPPDCVPMGQSAGTGKPTGSPTGTTYPTPIYPATTTTTTKAPTTKPPTTVTPTPTISPTVLPTIPTPKTEAPTTASGIPSPPSPSTNDPNVPMPPTPAPTPPSVSVEPPYVPIPVG